MSFEQVVMILEVVAVFWMIQKDKGRGVGEDIYI